RSRFLWEGNGASSLMEGPARWTTGHSRAASDVCFGETPFAACSAPMSATLTGTSTVACRRLRRQANSRHIGAGGVRSHVAVIVAHFTPAVRAVMAATKTIPIVMVAGAPLQSGFIKSLYEPGGNVTGLSAMDAELGGKRIQLLSDLIPKLACVGVLATT